MSIRVGKQSKNLLGILGLYVICLKLPADDHRNNENCGKPVASVTARSCMHSSSLNESQVWSSRLEETNIVMEN